MAGKVGEGPGQRVFGSFFHESSGQLLEVLSSLNLFVPQFPHL
jgi:hypothetical protein